jgi:hypothetical protein
VLKERLFFGVKTHEEVIRTRKHFFHDQSFIAQDFPPSVDMLISRPGTVKSFPAKKHKRMVFCEIRGDLLGFFVPD